MKHRYLIITTISTLLLLIIACLLADQFFWNGCLWWQCAPNRNFHVLDWEIPKDLFPEGTITENISVPSEGIGEIEGGFQYIHIDDARAVYDIYRFPRIEEAISHFEHYKRGMVDPTTGTVWEVPSELTFASNSADDLFYACGYFLQEYRCEMAARYREYTLFFGMTMNDKMTYDVFQNVLIFLDKQLSSRLYP